MISGISLFLLWNYNVVMVFHYSIMGFFLYIMAMEFLNANVKLLILHISFYCSIMEFSQHNRNNGILLYSAKRILLM